jgi:hypothetical protein
MHSLLTVQTGRLDRHVRRSYLHLGAETSRHRVAFSLEEALRLISMPGEEEGRIYCFRRMSLNGVEAEADRRVWIHVVGRVMEELAAQAKHGSHPFAGSGNAVYFHSREEALEALLHVALREVEHGVSNSPSWFSCSLLGLPPETCYEKQIRTVVEELQHSGNPTSNAALLFAALGEQSSIKLISAIPDEQFRAWLRTLDAGAPDTATHFATLPNRLATPLHRAGVECGWTAPGTVWLAVQAVLCSAPAARYSASLVSTARVLLRQLQVESGGREDAIPFTRRSTRLLFEEAIETQKPNVGSSKLFSEELNGASDNGRTRESGGDSPSGEELRAEIRISAEEARSAATTASASQPGELAQSLAPLLGESTTSGGLFFLLHVLRHLGMPPLVGMYPALAEVDFAGHVLRALADKTRMSEDDPIRRCLPPRSARFSLPLELLRDAEFMNCASPTEFRWRAIPSSDSEDLLRIWTLAVRRWCWSTARLTLADVVHRPGKIWLTRTDLDVTFSLSLTDIRIRRTGLDIDPGWVPWFGQFGKVVRFHYREGGGN